MPEHEPCEEVGLHRSKLDKIFEDKLPALSNCIKDMGSRCHTQREKGDKDLDKKVEKKVDKVMFRWIVGTVISLTLLFTGIGIKYTYSQSVANATQHEQLVTQDELDDKLEQVKEDIKEIKQSAKETAKSVRQMELNQNTILNAVKNLER